MKAAILNAFPFKGYMTAQWNVNAPLYSEQYADINDIGTQLKWGTYDDFLKNDLRLKPNPYRSLNQYITHSGLGIGYELIPILDLVLKLY